MSRGNWNELKHIERIKILKDQNDGEIVEDFLPPDTGRDEFARHLREQRELWEPDKITRIDDWTLAKIGSEKPSKPSESGWFSKNLSSCAN